jgi:uncharacterized coiled-coil protein SlyX
MSLERSLNLLMDSLLSLEGRLENLEKAMAEKQEPISEDWAQARLDEVIWRLEKLEEVRREVTDIFVQGVLMDSRISQLEAKANG